MISRFIHEKTQAHDYGFCMTLRFIHTKTQATIITQNSLNSIPHDFTVPHELNSLNNRVSA